LKHERDNTARDKRSGAGDDLFDDGAALEAAYDDSPEEEDADEATAGGKSGFPYWWLVASCLCLITAVRLWLYGYPDGAFVAAALGVVAWFLNVRAGLRRKNGDVDTEA
jgi:hypothetical protein